MEAQVGGPIQAPTTEGLPKDYNLSAEIKYLQAYLLQSGLTPRAPDAERGHTSSGCRVWTRSLSLTHVSETPCIEDLYVDLRSRKEYVVAQRGA